MYKLVNYGVRGNMYNVIKSIYSVSFNSVLLNEQKTDWFMCKQGVRQGDTLSPTLFGMYLNYLSNVINEKKCGVDIGFRELSCLAYADDLALISDSEENLQTLLDTLNEWCVNWRIKINISK